MCQTAVLLKQERCLCVSDCCITETGEVCVCQTAVLLKQERRLCVSDCCTGEKGEVCVCGRLLYVDPMVRMTVQELAAHPWLDRTCCAHNKTPLSSPIMLANRVSLCP